MNDKENTLRLENLNCLSTAELEEIIRTDAEDMASKNREVVSAVLSILQAREVEKLSEEPVNVRDAWQRFQRLYNTPDGVDSSLFPVEDSQEPASQKPRKGSAWSVWVRCASVAAVLCLIITLVAPVFGSNNITTLFAQWRNSLFSFLFEGDMPTEPTECVFSTDNPALQEIYDSVTALGISTPVVPMWIPEGCALNALEFIDSPVSRRVTATMTDGSGYVVLFSIVVGDESNCVHYTDAVEPEILEVGNSQHYIMANNDKWMAVWTDNEVICTISTDYSKDVLLEMLKSIYFTR